MTKLTLEELTIYNGQGSGMKAGKYLRFYCPIHGGDNQRSFSLNLETGYFRCFTCGAKGKIDKYISGNTVIADNKKDSEALNIEELKKQITDNLYNKYPELNKIQSATGLASYKAKLVEDELKKYTNNIDLDAELIHLKRALPDSIGEKYLIQRGISLEIAQEYEIGYAPQWKWPQYSKGIAVMQYKHGRLVFPHTDIEGNIINLYGRAVELDEEVPKHLKHTHLSRPKGVFNAKAMLADTVFICEGVFDALSLIVSGYENSCAVFGVDNIHLDWVKSKKIVFCMDNDTAGQRWKKLALEAVLLGKTVYYLPEEVYQGCKDLNELLIMNGYISLDYFDST